MANGPNPDDAAEREEGRAATRLVHVGIPHAARAIGVVDIVGLTRAVVDDVVRLQGVRAVVWPSLCLVVPSPSLTGAGFFGFFFWFFFLPRGLLNRSACQGWPRTTIEGPLSSGSGRRCRDTSAAPHPTQHLPL